MHREREVIRRWCARYKLRGVVGIQHDRLFGRERADVDMLCAEQPDLFNRFYRGTNAVEGTIPGSGLGLAISQVIAEAHGGAIQLESTPGSGSTFRLALPLA